MGSNLCALKEEGGRDVGGGRLTREALIHELTPESSGINARQSGQS